MEGAELDALFQRLEERTRFASEAPAFVKYLVGARDEPLPTTYTYIPRERREAVGATPTTTARAAAPAAAAPALKKKAFTPSKALLERMKAAKQKKSQVNLD